MLNELPEYVRKEIIKEYGLEDAFMPSTSKAKGKRLFYFYKCAFFVYRKLLCIFGVFRAGRKKIRWETVDFQPVVVRPAERRDRRVAEVRDTSR